MYKPLVEIVPVAELSDQVTAVFVDPLTEAVNCCVCAGASVDVPGETETDTGTETDGFTVTVALDFLVVSATLVAVTVTVWELLTLEGAVYKPLLEIVPVAELRDQLTAVLLRPTTVATNCWVCDGVSTTLPGATETPWGPRVMIAVAVLTGLVSVVTVTVTAWTDATDEGAV